MEDNKGQFREIFEKSPIGIIFYNKKGITINANNSALKMLGIPKLEGILGISLFDNPFIEEEKQKLIDEGIIKFQAPLDLNRIIDFGLYYPTKNEFLFLDYTVSVTDSGFMAQIQDITEQNKAKNDLKIKEEQLRLSLEAGNAGMWIRDPIGDWKATPQLNTLFGRSIDDPPLLEEEFRDYIHPEDLPLLEKTWRSAKDGETTYDQEYRVIWPDGSIHWLASKGKIVLEGDMPRFMGITYDISERKKAENALKDSKEFAENLIETANVMVLGLDPDGKINIFNNAAEKITGYSREEVLNNSYELFVPRDRYEYVWKEFDRLMEGGMPKNYENPILTKSGEERYITWQNNEVYENGQIVGVISFGIDITERKKAEEELKKSEAQYRNIIENVQDAYFRGDKEGKIIMVSNSAAKMYGYDSPEEMKGLPVSSLYKSEDERNFVLNELKKHGKIVDNEIEAVKKDGTLLWVSQNAQYYYDNGEIQGTEAFVRDITRRKQLEEELRQARDNLEEKVKKRTVELLNERDNLNSVLGKTKSGIYIVNSDYELEYVNPIIEKDFGLVKGQKCHEYFYDKDNICSDCKIKIAFDGDLVEWEQHSVKSNKTYDALATPITKIDGSIAVVVFLYDVTRRDKAEIQLKETISELERSNKELQSFAYITSHDLQEPLRTMGSYAGLLKKRYKGQFDPDADDFLNYMVSGAQRMQGMIQGLLDYSRVGTHGEDFIKFDAEDALKTALSNLESSIQECHAEITQDKMPNITADKDQITRIFQNLIGNALKFRKEGVQPKIHISARKKDNECIFSVKDNGIGIEEQYSDKIFEVFKRLHAIDEYKGAGIGLAIIKRIIERHGGRVWVESELGVGSTFYFTIPIEQVGNGCKHS